MGNLYMLCVYKCIYYRLDSSFFRYMHVYIFSSKIGLSLVLTSDMAEAGAPPTAERLQHVDVNIKDVYVSPRT